MPSPQALLVLGARHLTDPLTLTDVFWEMQTPHFVLTMAIRAVHWRFDIEPQSQCFLLCLCGRSCDGRGVGEVSIRPPTSPRTWPFC